MHKFALSGVLLAISGTAMAQCAPPSDIWTANPFTASHYAGSPLPFNAPAYTGIQNVCDVTLQVPLTFNQIDVLLYEDAIAPDNPNLSGIAAGGTLSTVNTTGLVPGQWNGGTIGWTTPATPGTSTALSTTTMVDDSVGGFVLNTFAGGTITFTSGLNNTVTRPIVGNSANQVTWTNPLSTAPAPGDTYTLAKAPGTYSILSNTASVILINGTLAVVPAPGDTFVLHVPPHYVLTTIPVTVWAIPGSWVGNMTSATPPTPPAGWTAVSTGSAVIQNSATHTQCVVAPFTLAAGSYGLAVQLGPYFDPTIDPMSGLPIGNIALHPLLTISSFNPTLPLSQSNQVISVANENFQRIAWQSGTSGNTIIDNMEFHFTVGAGCAYFTDFGVGCYNKPPTTYEEFGSSGSFDMANTSMLWIPGVGPTGPNYIIVPSASTITAPASAPLLDSGSLPMGDDDLSAPIPLGFTFNYAGGSTSTITVGSNGVIWLNGTSTHTYGYYNDIYTICNGPDASIAALYGDHLPSTAGGTGDVYCDIDPINQLVYVTWLNIAEWNNAGTAYNMQIVLNAASGEFEFIYGAVTPGSGPSFAPLFTGFSPANITPIPGQVDFDVSLPYTTGDGTSPPVLTATGRPVIGSTISLDTSNIAANTFVAVNSLSLTNIPTGLDLTFAGMPGCSLYLNPTPILLNFFTINGGGVGPVESYSLPIPANPTLNGLELNFQTGVFSAGLNPAGILVSNATCLRLGVN
jgi:hypothetical protein